MSIESTNKEEPIIYEREVPLYYVYADPKTRVTLRIKGELLTFTDGQWIPETEGAKAIISIIQKYALSALRNQDLATEVIEHSLGKMFDYEIVHIEEAEREDLSDDPEAIS